MPVAEQVRSYAGSPGGSKVVPAVSLGLVIIGVVLVLVSLTSSPGPEPVVPVAEPTAPADLTLAMKVAKETMLAKRPHSYDRFDAKSASAQEGSLAWTDDGPATEGEISIRTSGRTKIVLVSKDVATGTVYCIADTNGDEETSKGEVDAKNPAECTGGWTVA